MSDIKCTDKLTLSFSGSYTVPAIYGDVKPDQFSIATSTDGLVVYKDIVEYPVTNMQGPCDTIITNATVKLGQVKVSGVIFYRVAANGIQTDNLIIPAELQNTVNVNGNIWSSTDGFVEVRDNINNYVTVGFVLPSEEVDASKLKVTLKSLVLGSVTVEQRSDDLVVTLEGEFELSYGDEVTP